MAISVAFFIVILLILWFVIGSKGPWVVKAVVILFSLHLCLSIQYSLSGIAGWPSSDPLPQKFIAHWIIIHEPPKKTPEKGAIYVWATTLSEEQETDSSRWWVTFLLPFESPDLTEPRSYRLPYSKELHESANGALGRIMNGERVGGTNNGPMGDGKGNGGKEGEGEGKGGGTFSHSDDISYHDLPAPHLPDKD